MKTATLAIAAGICGAAAILLATATLLRPAERKPYFNVQLNTGEYWACYPRPERNLVPLCIPRETAP
jgi:hypothetical protein